MHASLCYILSRTSLLWQFVHMGDIVFMIIFPQSFSVNLRTVQLRIKDIWTVQSRNPCLPSVLNIGGRSPWQCRIQTCCNFNPADPYIFWKRVTCFIWSCAGFHFRICKLLKCHFVEITQSIAAPDRASHPLSEYIWVGGVGITICLNSVLPRTAIVLQWFKRAKTLGKPGIVIGTVHIMFFNIR